MTFVRETLLITGRHLRASARDPGSAYIAPTIIPLAIVGIVSQIFGVTADLPGFPTEHFIDWLLPGMVIMTGMFGGGATAVRVIRDHHTGYLDRLALLPTRPAAVLAGAAVFDAVRTIPPAVAVLGLGLLLGAPLETGIGGAVVLVAVAMVWSMTWNTVFLIVGLRTRSEQATLAVVPLFLPLWWTSTVLINEDLMPDWIRRVSQVNPISLLADAFRPLGTGGGLEASAIIASIVVVGAVLVALQVVAAFLFRNLRPTG